jgi:hypothetical protein
VTVRGDDFDRRRVDSEASSDVAVEHPKVPGKHTLVEVELARPTGRPAAPGRRTLVEEVDHQRDPEVDLAVHVQKARELMTKLAAKPAPHEERAICADLHRHLDEAKRLASHCGSEGVGAVFQLVLDARQYVDATLSPTEAAQRGIEGPSQRLPFHDQIQRAFGSHDISQIQAHIGGTAADASRELGARAYAFGDHVAFASSPSLGLAAHEAAHVIQQRAGVSLKGIDGGASESYEQHADAVADAVVRGESAEQLVQQRSSGAPAVQRKDRDAHEQQSAQMDDKLVEAERYGQNITAPAFVQLHIAELRRNIDVFLVSRAITTGVADVTFTPDIGPFITGLFAGFDQDDNAAKVTRLRNWVAPADLYAIVDRNRPIFEIDKATVMWSGNPNAALDYGAGRKGPPQYANAVAVGIGSALEERLFESLKRMSQQLVAATAKHRAAGKDKPVVASELVPAHPLDWQVALAMVGRGEPTIQVACGPLHADPVAQVTYRKITRVEWQGAAGGPWNAVRVEPSDARPEAVAAEVLGASTEAYRIQRVGPFFLIPEDQAIRFPQAAWYRRTGQRDAVQDLAYGKNAATVERAETERSLATDAKAPTSGELQQQWKAIRDQLLGISVVVRPYGLDTDLGLVLSRHAAHAVDLTTLSGHDAAVRGQLFAKQANLLERVGAQVAALTANAPAPKPGPSSKFVHDMLAKLVRVANLSHLPETGDAAMGDVVTAQRAAVPDALEAALGDIATQIEIARLTGEQAQSARHRSEGTYGSTLADRADKLRQRVAVFRSQTLRDQADASELEVLGRDIDALRFEAGVIAEVGQLGQLFHVLDQLEESNWVLFSEGLTAKISETTDDNAIGRLETARRGSMDLRTDLNRIHAEWLRVEKTAQSIEANLSEGGVKNADAAARALVQPRIAAIQSKLKKLGGEEAVQTFLKDAYDKIDSAKTRAMIVQIATMIGVAALSSATGGVAGGVAEGMGMGTVGVTMVSLTAETAMFTAVSARLSGEPMVAAFINNYVGNLLTFAAMRGVGKMLGGTAVGRTLAAAKAGASVRTAALLLAKTGELTAQTLVATGMQIAQAEYESLRTTGHAMSTHDLEVTAAQGMAMMIGTAISHRVLGDPSLVAHTVGNEIGARVAKLRGMSEAVATGGDPSQAIALMEQTRALIEDIGNRAKALSGKSDHELSALGYTRAQVEALAKFAGTQSKALASMDAGSFAAQLGLHTVVPGRVFSGAVHEIDAVVGDFRSHGYSVEQTGEGFRVTKKDEAPIDLFVRSGQEAPGQDRASQPESSPPPEHAHTAGGNQHAHPSTRGRGTPLRTPYGDVWPGDVPDSAPPEQRALFESARKIYEGYKADTYEGASLGRIAWAKYLGDHGINVDTIVRDGGVHDVYEHVVVPQRPAAASDLAIPRGTGMDARSHNTGHVTRATCISALGELMGRGTMLKGVHQKGGGVLAVPAASGKEWTITIAAPKSTAPDAMAALEHGEHGDTVWVSDTLTDEQVPRALGAILGESMAHAGRGSTDSRTYGELDAMFSHRDVVASAERPARPGPDATPTTIKQHAAAASREESTARIDTEIDLALLRMNLMEPGPARDEKLASMPPDLATKVRARLAQQQTISFRSDSAVADGAVARPREMPTTTLATSSVFPDAPARVRPYGKADLAIVMELRVELATIKEIDARISLRDQPGTSKGKDIARGETLRRAQHVKRVRELLSELQLGGGDTSYLEARLEELSKVFPGIERDVVPAVRERVARRASAEAVHEQAEVFRRALVQQQKHIMADVASKHPYTTKRIIGGGGASAVADVATLGVSRDRTWIDPAELLVIGKPDLLEQLDPASLFGQRGAVFDREQAAHPAFADANGRGTGQLLGAIEDPGEFMHVGEFRDAMDLARQRLGIAAVPGLVLQVETVASRRPGTPEWEVDSHQYPVRVKANLGGSDIVIYTEYTDLIPGPGRPRMPNEQVLSANDRDSLMDPKNGGALFSGEALLELQKDVRGKRVLVLGLGPTGGWTAKAAAKAGAARVDFAGAGGGELGSGTTLPVAGQKAAQRKVEEKTPGNDLGLGGMNEIDRLQDVLDGDANVHLTLDRVVHIEPGDGGGAVVTYAHGQGENAELYQVHYDAIAVTMGYTQAGSAVVDAATAERMVGTEPTVKDIIGDMSMVPQRGTRAPVTEDEATGRVRVMGIAAGDGVNVSDQRTRGKDDSDQDVLKARGDDVASEASADSPNSGVLEAAGKAIRTANTRKKGER